MVRRVEGLEEHVAELGRFVEERGVHVKVVPGGGGGEVVCGEEAAEVPGRGFEDVDRVERAGGEVEGGDGRDGFIKFGLQAHDPEGVWAGVLVHMCGVVEKRAGVST